MTTFDDRETAFESRFAHDQELEFRAIARRNKLIGHWAAERMGLDAAAAEDYAQSVVRADFEEAGDADVMRKLKTDLAAAGLAVEEAEIRQKMYDLLLLARTQVATSG